MSKLDDDIESAIKWLANVAGELMGSGNKHYNAGDWLFGKADTIISCATLPGDMPLRVRCQPRVFEFKA